VKEYTAASLAVLLLALALAAARGLWRDRALWLGLLVFVAMTLAADGVLTAIGVYDYDRRFNAGVYLGRMPLEDLAYAVALYLVAVAAWSGREARDG
jgi:lycopene cyclase domain-containing protein